MRFNCDCWDKPSCPHGSSALTVVIGDCELAHPVDSVVDASTKSKALKVCEYKYPIALVYCPTCSCWVPCIKSRGLKWFMMIMILPSALSSYSP